MSTQVEKRVNISSLLCILVSYHHINTGLAYKNICLSCVHLQVAGVCSPNEGLARLDSRLWFGFRFALFLFLWETIGIPGSIFSHGNVRSTEGSHWKPLLASNPTLITQVKLSQSQGVRKCTLPTLRPWEGDYMCSCSTVVEPIIQFIILKANNVSGLKL
jgi:hypothetical protein